MQTLSGLETFEVLAKSSLLLAMNMWPVSIGLLLVAVAALTVGTPLRDPLFRQRLPLMLATYAIPLLVLMVGAVFRYDWKANPNWVEPPHWYGVVLWTVIVIHALALVAALVFMRGARLRSTAIVLPGFWLSLSAGFMAGIAIAGVGP